MNSRVPEILEWEETKLAMNAHNQMEQIKEPVTFKKKGLVLDQEQEIYGLLTIDNKKEQEFKVELQKMIVQNTQPQNHYLVKKQDNQKDRIEYSQQQITESIITTDILPQEITQNRQQFQHFGDKKLFLIIKGEGFKEFRIRSICFKLKCPSCKECLPCSAFKQQQQNIYKFQSNCKKCSLSMSIAYQKYIQLQQSEKSESLTQWIIGSIKNYENIEWQLCAIQAQAICKCLKNSSALPFIQYSLEKTKQIVTQNKRQKFLIIDQNRLFCHGCAQELQFLPEFLIIKD
ncbi:unnamed protein product [Paramecium primaurelia]|uniref:Uncharacterized protein n=1 Tax=Paramecium primaurelia TaxID=5886 RepID=A0A8S1KMH5_PARPR|nr:unnamed protein product [Paramecium primaurelia]CAD8054196.1 unnamed protein product [Paramecium primaurelia]